ncbi:MAG: hypothetical protein L0I76_30480 [Pseudonocardia sp.]|nr:hypothetical protein [Pseudonocardia sp.]
MGLFSSSKGSDGASNKGDTKGTLNDAQYRALQRSALKANPKHGQAGSKESVEGSKRGAENYAKRWWN